MPVVGLVTHSGAAQDEGRITSLARTMDVDERVNVTARILAGMAAVPGVRVLYLSEPTRLVERALACLAALPEATTVDARPVAGTGARAAAAALAEAGAAGVVTFGGDGVNRAVAAGWPGAVIVPLAGGTDDAFALPVDPTAAGMAAALYAADRDAFAGVLRQAPRWRITTAGRPEETALVEVALLGDDSAGAHAAWDAGRLREALVVGADPTVPGLAGVAGLAGPPDASAPGVHMRFGRPGRRLLAPLGPGRLAPLWLGELSHVGVGRPVTLAGPGTLALDGEPGLVLRAGDEAAVQLAADGPRVLGVGAVLRAHARAGAGAGASRQRDPITTPAGR